MTRAVRCGGDNGGDVVARSHLVLVGGELRLEGGNDHLPLLDQVLRDLHAVLGLLSSLVNRSICGGLFVCNDKRTYRDTIATAGGDAFMSAVGGLLSFDREHKPDRSVS